MQAKQTKFAQALTLRTEVPDSLTGERQEVFTLSGAQVGQRREKQHHRVHGL